MGNWYRVIKTIKGHPYLYEQRSWREGARIRTECRSLGRADGGGRGAATGGNRQRKFNTTKKTGGAAGLRHTSVLDALPLFKGKAYRAETFNFPKAGVALDLIEYDERELGNVGDFEHLSPAARSALATVPIRDITWVTKSRTAAEKYGDVDEVYDRGARPRIIAEDGDGGYLILKDRSRAK